MDNIPAFIAAIAFAALVIAAAVPLLKLGKVFDELRDSVRSVTDNANEVVKESAAVVHAANDQIERVDAVSASAARVAEDVSALSTLISATVGGPLIKVAAFNYAVRQALGSKGKK